MDAKEIVTGFFADIDAGDAGAAFARLSPDLAYRVVAPSPGGGTFDLAGMQANAMAVFDKMAGPIRLTVKRVVAEGEHVVVQAESTAPTKAGGEYRNSYLFLFRVVGGRIVEGAEYLDSAHLRDLMADRLTGPA